MSILSRLDCDQLQLQLHPLPLPKLELNRTTHFKLWNNLVAQYYFVPRVYSIVLITFFFDPISLPLSSTLGFQPSFSPLAVCNFHMSTEIPAPAAQSKQS